VMADPAPTWLSVGWASMIVLILGRMILESVTGGRIRYRAAAPQIPVSPAPAAVPARTRASATVPPPRDEPVTVAG
jgi:cellulose synthase (UDP-forming)